MRPEVGQRLQVFNTSDVQSAAHQETDSLEDGEVQTTARHSGEEVQDSPDEKKPSLGDGQSATHEFSTENSIKEITSSSTNRQLEAKIAAHPADDDSRKEKIPNDQVRQCLDAFVRASGISMPSGPIPAGEIASGLTNIGATTADLIEFLKGYARHWREAPATWRHVLVSFQHWADDPRTSERIKVTRALHEATQRERQARIQRERLMNTPLNFVQSVALLDGGVRIPWPLKARLERTGTLITATNLRNEAGRWQRCPKCEDVGLCGSAIDKTLRFCACFAGEELQYRNGANWPERETARVHKDARSLLTAACYELKMPFAGDAMAEAQVLDSPPILEIIPTLLHARIGVISQSEMTRILRRIGWERVVKIASSASSAGAAA